MRIITIDSIIPTPNGIRVEGTYDPGQEDVVSIRVEYRLSQDNKGSISHAQAGPGGVIRVTTPTAHNLRAADHLTVFGVRGTEEANGDWHVRVVSNTILDLRNTHFSNQHTTGTGSWFVNDLTENSSRVAGEPPPRIWTHEVLLQRPAVYDVRAQLFWTGSPSIITTPFQGVTVSLQ